MDADVRLASDALARISDYLAANDEALVSGIPKQELETFSERLLLPLIHFVLLGYLPVPVMKWTKWPAFSAGCGQLLAMQRDAYFAVGGHTEVRTTLHDGVKLPRLFRSKGFRTGLFDATDLASCRMYHTNAEVWQGLGKNATEGLAAPAAILPMTALLFGGQVLPFLLLAAFPVLSPVGLVTTIMAVVLAWLPRFVLHKRSQQPLASAWLHPIGVAALLFIQWHALFGKIFGRPALWKGRSYGGALRQA